MKEKPDRKVIITVSVTTIIVLVLAWLVVFFLGGKVREYFENYQKEKLNSFVLEENRNKILKLERELPNLEEEKDRLNSMLVKKDMAVPFLRALEKVASDTNCQIAIEPADISKIKFEKKSSSSSKKQDEDETNADTANGEDQAKASEAKSKKQDDLASLKDYPAFSVVITGHFSSIVDFMTKFENIPYFVHPLVIDIFSDEKKNTAAANARTLSAGTPNSSENENWDEKNIKMDMTFVVYGE
jgi:hypothetical protein